MSERAEYQVLELPKTIKPGAWPRVRRLLVWIVVLAGLSAAGFHWRGQLGRWFRGARAAFAAPRQQSDSSRLLTHTVQVDDLEITTLVSGTLESASSSPVHSEVEGQASIVKLLPEGTQVQEGDVVVELDSSALRTKLTEQQIVVEKVRNAYGQTQQANAVAENKAQNDLAAAEKALEFARLDLQKYEKGEYPVKQRQMQIEIALAEEELERAQTELSLTEDLAADRYIHQGEVDAERFRVKQSQYKVDNARENARLLEEYGHPRQMRDLESKVAEAERNLALVKGNAAINAEQSAKNLEAEQRTLELEEAKLAYLEAQIEKCTLRAPRAGLVVYPVPPDEDMIDEFIKQGNPIRDRQHVFSIPDTDVLQVSADVHEAVVNQVRKGMQARVWVDKAPDDVLRGEVQSVSRFPNELGDWRRATVKFYDAKVQIIDRREDQDLRPGMSAKVEILLDRVRDALVVPVQSVLQRGEAGLCYVLGPAGPELRRLRLGKASYEYITVLEGLEAGERVVLSPDTLGFPADALEEIEGTRWGGGEDDDEPGAETATTGPAPDANAPDGEERGRTGEGGTEEEPQETQYEADLVGSGSATGEVEFEITTGGEQPLYEFEVSVEGGTPGATLDVAVDGVVVGSITLDGSGNQKTEWKSEWNTFPANFPLQAGEGSTVVVGGDLEGRLALEQKE